MSKSIIAIASTLLLAGLLLPAEALARLLAQDDGERLRQIATGVLIFKGALALNGLLLVLAARFAPRHGIWEPLARGVRAAPRWRPSTLWAIGGLLALGLALRLTRLEVGLSFDEIDTLTHYARKPLAVIATTFDSQNQHLFYSLLARLSLLACGDSAWAVRLPAALLGVLGILALYRFALLVTDAREAIFAAALLTVSYHHVWFSQDARGYTGLLLFTLLGSDVFLRMLSERGPRGLRRPLAYGAWMALATLTHATALFVLAAHGLVWLATLWNSRARARATQRFQPAFGFAFAASFTLLVYALVLPQFVHTLLAPTMPGVSTQWKEPLWLVRETLAGFSRGVPGGGVTLAGALVVAALGVRSYAKQGIALLGTFLLPALVTAAALLATHHNLWPRMFFFGAGFYVLIALRGIAEWARIFSFGQIPALVAKLTTGAMALACLMSAATLPVAWLPKQDFEGPRAYLAERAAPADAIVTVDMTVLPYAEHFIEPWTAVDNVDALLRIESAHPRTWIVFTTPTRMKSAQPAIWERLQTEYRTARTFWGTLGGSEVVVAVRGADLPDDLEGSSR